MKQVLLLLMTFVTFLGTAQNQSSLPITFDDASVDYVLVSFGSAIDSIVVDPTNPNNMVMRQDQPSGAQTWAGTVVGDSGLVNAIPFAMGSTVMSARVWSPDAGTPILMKVEDANDGTISVETITNTTVSGMWETLTFDFSNQAPGTAAINLANTYNKVVVFCDFGNAKSGKTYFIDDIMFGAPLAQTDLPITFDDSNVNYNTVSFGDAVDSIVVDPTNSANMVLLQHKPANAQTWAGTVIGDGGLANAIPFTANSNLMTARIWSPDSGTPVLMKVENTADGTISVETFAYTTMASMWETLTFDFTNNASGTPPIDYTKTYDKVVLFNGFGNTGTAKTYFIDDIMFGAPMTQVDLPITFDDSNIDYNTVSFGDAADSIVVDPTNSANMVLLQHKPANAQTWAGTVLGDGGLANAIPFTANSNLMTARIWSPDSGTPVLMKVENTADGTISVETFAYTTMAGMWETLTFDFTNNVAGTPAIDYTKTYDKVVLFSDFGNTGTAKTFYIDDVMFGGSGIGIKENWLTNLSLHPNPTSGIVNLEANFINTNEAEVVIFDVQGRVVYQLTETGTILNQQIDLTHLSCGLYVVRITSKHGIVTGKILKSN